MDGYQFIAAIFQSLVSLAWPMAVVICVWLFREKLRTLLPFLRMKYKDLDVSFRLEQAEREAAQIPKPPALPESEPTPEEKSRFEQVAERSPRAAILEKRAELENALRSVAEPYLSTTKSWKNVSLAESVRTLRRHGIIGEQTSALLDDLRTVGNQAAHSQNGNEFTEEDALRFGRLTDEAITLVRALE